MKRIIPVMLILCLLCGCADTDKPLASALALRSQAQQSPFTFDAKITADYGDELQTFTLQCAVATDGTVSFTVTQPSSISGITGNLRATGGELTFDDKALAFPMLADGEISPVSAPWIFVSTLRGGYIRSCGADGERLRLTIDDSYQDDALQLDIWLDGQQLPVYTEILWQGRRFLSMEISNFTFL